MSWKMGMVAAMYEAQSVSLKMVEEVMEGPHGEYININVGASARLRLAEQTHDL